MAATRTVVLPLEEHPALSKTLSESARAYSIISQAAFEYRTRSAVALQQLVYSQVRTATKLTAQMTCSAIRHVASAYKSARSNGHKLEQPADFDGKCLALQSGARGREFRLYPERRIVSISTVEGRKKLSYRCGEHQRRYLQSPEWMVQAARLLYKRRRKGYRYELHVQVIQEIPKPANTAGEVLGVDTGRRYLAVASTGEDAYFCRAGHLKPKKEAPRYIVWVEGRGSLPAMR